MAERTPPPMDLFEFTTARHCKQCGEFKPRAEFYEHKGCLDGVRPRCKTCECENERRRYEADPGSRLAQQKLRRLTDPVGASAATTKWRKKNPDKVRARGARYWQATKADQRDSRRDYFLRIKFGLTLVERDALAEEQGHRCAICGVAESEFGRSLAVDHDHDSGHVRGLLCQGCNCTLGLMRDNPQLLETAASYLRAHAAKGIAHAHQVVVERPDQGRC